MDLADEHLHCEAFVIALEKESPMLSKQSVSFAQALLFILTRWTSSFIDVCWGNRCHQATIESRSSLYISRHWNLTVMYSFAHFLRFLFQYGICKYTWESLSTQISRRCPRMPPSTTSRLAFVFGTFIVIVFGIYYQVILQKVLLHGGYWRSRIEGINNEHCHQIPGLEACESTWKIPMIPQSR